MDTDRADREFILHVTEAAGKAGASGALMRDLVARALMAKDTGRWTNTAAFLNGLRQAAPTFFVDGVTPPPEAHPEPTPKAPVVTTRLAPGVLYICNGLQSKPAGTALTTCFGTTFVAPDDPTRTGFRASEPAIIPMRLQSTALGPHYP